MNGLGRAFEAFGWNHPRHWLNQAVRRLEDVKLGGIIGGIPAGMNDPLKVVSEDTNQTFSDRFNCVDSLASMRRGALDFGAENDNFITFINAMRPRISTDPVDKYFSSRIATTICRLDLLPLYDGGLCPEDAWGTCIEHLSTRMLRVLLFKFHIPGNGGVTWRPSWSQLMDNDAHEISNGYTAGPAVPL